MEVESLSGRWTKFKKRLGCCGGIFRMTINIVEADDDDNGDDSQVLNLNHTPLQDRTDPGWMSLAMALEVERELRVEKRQSRESLMRLLEDTEEGGAGHDEEGDMVCCVCVTRRKGAAFIPCGHTFCRACAREVSVRRGTCPLCNGKIHEVLRLY